MKSVRHLARLGAVALLAASAVGVVAPLTAVSPVAAAGLAGGGEFHALPPARIFDSRPESPVFDVAPLGAKPQAPGEPTFDVRVLGRGGVPSDPAQVLAVVANITVTDPGSAGWLEAYGKGARPATRTSLINISAGQTVPNLSIVRPGVDGDLTIGLFGMSAGTAHVLIDVFGYFTTSSVPAGTGARLIPVSPSRVLDTRDGTHRTPANAPLAAAETLTLQIRGVDGVSPARPAVVPNSPEVTGVLLNVVGVTQVAGGTNTYLSLFPDALPAGTVPSTSNLNLVPNTIKANLVAVPVGADGSIRIFNHSGATHVVADVVGYFRGNQPEATRAGRVVPLSSPYRTFDTRDPSFGGVALGPGQAEDWSFADFSSSVAIGPDAVGNQSAVIGNLTSASLTRQYPSAPVASYLTAYPGGLPLPGSSNLNSFEKQEIPNMAILTYGANNVVRFYNNTGYAHYLFDASAVVLAD